LTFCGFVATFADEFGKSSFKRARLYAHRIARGHSHYRYSRRSALPGMASAKLNAYKVKCASNLRQLSFAFAMYRGDNNGSMMAWGNSGEGLTQGSWADLLSKYVGSASNVLMCPVVPNLTAQQIQAGLGNADWGSCTLPWMDDYEMTGQNLMESCYLFNGWFYDPTDPYGTNVPAARFSKESAVTRSSLTPVLCDGIWINTWPMETDKPDSPANLATGDATSGNSLVSGGGMGRVLIDRHGGIPPAKAPTAVPANSLLPGAINLGFYDCHVETGLLRNLWQYSWYANWQARGDPWTP
jgi:hypothetical protein